MHSMNVCVVQCVEPNDKQQRSHAMCTETWLNVLVDVNAAKNFHSH